MTNKEVLIQALQNFHGEYENNITDFIDCPYCGTCLNEENGIDYDNRLAWNEGCAECKREWLLKEWEE